MQETQLQATGIPALDTILCGGLLKGTLAVVLGVPGSGKTTLAGHLAFAAARAGRKALILTALSEPTSKLITHLRAFAFFDVDLLVDQVQVLSLQQALPNGLKATGDDILGMVRQFRANMLILDGFRGMRETEADLDQLAGRQFLYRLGTTLSALGVTTIVTSEADPRDPAFFPEMTTADVILGLHYAVRGVRHVRGFEVIKARGAAPLPGLHAFAIGDSGAEITPQLEALVAAEHIDPRNAAIPTAALRRERVPTGVPGLDDLLGGGGWRGQFTLLTGPPATGKTLLSLAWAKAAITASERVVFVSLRATQAELAFLAAPYAWGEHVQAAWQPDRPIALLDPVSQAVDPDQLAAALLARITATGAQCVVIDGIEVLEGIIGRNGDSGRLEPYFTALRTALRARNVTTLVTRQTRADGNVSDLEQVADTLLHLRPAENGHGLELAVRWQHYAPTVRDWHSLSLTAPDGPRVTVGDAAPLPPRTEPRSE